MGIGIKVSTDHVKDVAIIGIQGDVTAATGEVIVKTYNDDSILNSPKILLEFDKDCYINIGGLAYLIDIVAAARKKEQIIYACGLSEHFQKLFHMVGLSKCISTYSSKDSALENL